MSDIDVNIEDLITRKQTKSTKLLINPILEILIDGVCDSDSTLSVLAGIPHVLQTIWNYVSRYWKTLIEKGVNLHQYDETYLVDLQGFTGLEKSCYLDVAFHELPVAGSGATLAFPPPRDICINMMPFIMERSFKKCKLPNYLKPYWKEIIDKNYYTNSTYSRLIHPSELGKIGYLTIHECYVSKNESQRRVGLHTDCPGKVMIAPNQNGEYVSIGRVNTEEESEINEILKSRLGKGSCHSAFILSHPISWGAGVHKHSFLGGIYMASNVKDSCEVVNCRILPDDNGEEIIGNLGDVEHLRDFMPKESTMMKANTMYWITDRTPHAALPLKEGSYRQYFRLVTSQVSVWFKDHSTMNPLGVMPDPTVTKIIKGSKFRKNWSLLQD